jgi:hypothetical protein
LEADEGTPQSKARPALFQIAGSFQPALQPFRTANPPDPAAHPSIPVAQSALPLATPPAVTTLPNVDTMPCYVQKGNSCGTTTLAEIMTYLGVHETQADIDGDIRQMNTFTAPDDMIKFAKDHDLEAEGYNNGSWDEVKAMIDAGHPVQAMVNGDSSVSVDNGSKAGHFSVNGLHYIVITGHGTDPATGEEYVTYHDPNRDVEQRMPVSDFEKMWGDVNLGGISGGFKDYFIAYGPDGSQLPPGRDDGIQGTLGTLSGVTNMTNGLARLWPPDSFGGVVHGLIEVPTGVAQTVCCGISAGLQMGADWLDAKVAGIPVLHNVVQPIGDVIHGAGAAVADVTNGLSEAMDDVGSGFEKLFKGEGRGFVKQMGNAVEDATSGVVNAVKDVGHSVVHAVEDIFSGW